MAKSSSGSMIGKWAFLIGVVIAIIVGVGLYTSPALLTILVVIGLIIGLLNVTSGEAYQFMTSGVVLIIASALGAASIGAIPAVSGILNALLAVFVPATVIVAIRNVFSLARN